jgi:hypothetical protein
MKRRKKHPSHREQQRRRLQSEHDRGVVRLKDGEGGVIKATPIHTGVLRLNRQTAQELGLVSISKGEGTASP